MAERADDPIHTSTVPCKGDRVWELKASFPRTQRGGLGGKNPHTLSFCLVKIHFSLNKL